MARSNLNSLLRLRKRCPVDEKVLVWFRSRTPRGLEIPLFGMCRRSEKLKRTELSSVMRPEATSRGTVSEIGPGSAFIISVYYFKFNAALKGNSLQIEAKFLSMRAFRFISKASHTSSGCAYIIKYY